MTNYAAVLSSLYPSVSWSINANDYDTLTWDESPKPTQAVLDAAWPQVQWDRQYAQVEQARRARYQAETDGLYFAAMREDTPTLAAWVAGVNAIKADLPKPAPL